MSTEAINRTRASATGDDRSERARDAVKVFRGMQHGLSSYARAITGNKRMRVQISNSIPHTDGDTIFYRPPIALGDKTPHQRQVCDLRHDDTGLLICPACAVREEVLVNIYHEIAHVAFGTFAQTTERAQRDAIDLAIAEWGGKYEKQIRQRMMMQPKLANTYMGLANLASPFMPHLVNCLEDARVDSSMFEARKGTRKMLQADTYSIIRDGSVHPETGEIIRWMDAPLNSQIALACYLVGAGYEDCFAYLHGKIAEDMADPQLVELTAKIKHCRTAADTYKLAFPILARLRELGYFLAPEEKKPEPDPEPEPEPEEEKQDDGDESDEPVQEPEAGDGQAGNEGDAEKAGPESDPSEDGGSEAGDGAEPGGDESDSAAGDDPGADGGAPSGDEGDDGESDRGAGADPDDAGDEGDVRGAEDQDESENDQGGEPDHAADGDQSDGDAEAAPGDEDEGGEASEGSEDGLDASEGSEQDGDGGTDTGADDPVEGDGQDASGDPGAGGVGDSTEFDPADNQDGQDGEGGPDAGSAGDTDADAKDGADPASSEADGGPDSSRAAPAEAEGDEPAGEGESVDGTDTDSVPQEAAGEGENVGDGTDPDSDSSGDEPPSEDSGKPVEGAGSTDSDARSDQPEGGAPGDGAPEHDEDADSRGEQAGQLEADSSTDGLGGSFAGREDGVPEGDDPNADERDEQSLEGADERPVDEGDRPDDDGLIDSTKQGMDLRDMTYGTPEEVEESRIHEHIAQGGYDEGSPTQANMQGVLDEQAVDIAVIQGLYFETPSLNVTGVEESSDIETGSAWAGLQRDPYDRTRRGIDCDMDVPESVMGPALQKLRRIFNDNKVTTHEHNRRSGRINKRVLGRRAWQDDDRLFSKKRVPGKRDYAVVLGIDISGSTVGANVALAKRAAMAQAELCQRLGVRFAVYAHSAEYSTNMTGLVMKVWIVKQWDDPWNEASQAKLAGLQGGGGNLDGHQVEYYRKVLDRIQATDKIMLYYTDGAMPASNYDEELEVLQREIKTCKGKGYTLMAVGIRTDSPLEHGLDTVQVDDDDDLKSVVDHLGKRLAGTGR